MILGADGLDETAIRFFRAREARCKRLLLLAIWIGFAPLSAADEASSNSPKMQTTADSIESSFGRSLFDELFLESNDDNTDYQIPYPFENAIQAIEENLGTSISGDNNSVKTVLIPLGRCINRYAAKPDYFKYPRVIIAAESEHLGREPRNSRFLKDRLFIGYQEKTKSMEVISYNDDLGRFEFQIVDNYGKKLKPIVQNVARSKCTGCHQNNGPIFSRTPWNETNDNRAIYKMLANELVNPAIGAIASPISDPGLLYNAVHRANRIKIFQQFWRGICQGKSPKDSVRCHAGLFELILRYRLQETNRSLVSSDLIDHYFIPESNARIQKLWPDGISILSSDIESKNPLRGDIQTHLESAADLLKPRSTLIERQPGNLFRMVEGLGNLISTESIRRLDEQIFAKAIEKNVQTTFRGECILTRTDEVDEFQAGTERFGDISIYCRQLAGGFSNSYQFYGEFYVESGKINSLPVFSQLVLSNQSSIIVFSHLGGQIEQDGVHSVIKLKLLDSNQIFHPRLPGSGIVEGLEIRWPINTTDALFDGYSTVNGSISLNVLPDSEYLETAFSRLISSMENESSNLLSDQPFRPQRLMDALFHTLLNE